MNILQVIPVLDPDILWAGPHKVVFDISRKLIERGNRVTVCTSDMLNIKKRVTKNSVDSFNGFEIIRVKNISSCLSSMLGLIITPTISGFLSERIQDYDIVHIHEYSTYQNIIVHRYVKKYGVPYVLQVHGSLPRIGKYARKWLYDAFFGFRLLRDASKVIALSHIEAKHYRDAGVPKEKIAIIPNGIDLSEYANLPPKGSFKKRFIIDEDQKIVLYLGRIHRIKGIDILTKAFAKIVDKLNNVKLVIVGPNDGYLHELWTLIKASRIEDKVLITGPLYGRDKLEAYVDADIYVLPSRYEIFGLGLLEAYACSKPVVASIVGGPKDMVVDGVTGLLFEPENIGQLSESILAMLNDGSRTERMGTKGREFVNRFTVEKTVDRLEALYKEVASRG